VGFALGWQPDPHVLGALLAVLAGTAAFASLGLLMAGVLRAEATLAAANLVYLLLMTAGAVVLPSSSYDGWGEVARWLPSGALGDAMRLSLIHGQAAWAELACLLGWAAVGALLTARTFRWE
jgi:ABC-2 type transport system permease protein